MSKALKTLALIYLSAFVIVVLSYVGDLFKFYWSIWWFDLFMHFIGGAWAGLLLISLSHHGPKFVRRLLYFRGFLGFSIYLFFVLLIGVGWEIYELTQGVVAALEPYPIDTFIDIVLDLVGAYVLKRISSSWSIFSYV